ncbi:MAG: hypothetical protein Kow0068_11660 [Marinilabiliales bacterium]
MQENKETVLVIAPPRSGTTWIANVLTKNTDYEYVHEPDNELINFFGFYYKNGLERFPYIKEKSKFNKFFKIFCTSCQFWIKTESNKNVFLNKLANVSKDKLEKQVKSTRHTYYKFKFWLKVVFLLGWLIKKKKKKTPCLIKSVHAHLSLPAIVEYTNLKPLIIFRHPCAIIASMIRLKLPDIDRKLYENPQIWKDFIEPYKENFYKLNDEHEFYGFQVGLFHYVLNQYIKNFNYFYVKYEDFYPEPVTKFKEIFNHFGIEFTDETKNYIMSKNKKGVGFKTNRDISSQINQWQKELSKNQIEKIMKGYYVFPNQHLYTV